MSGIRANDATPPRRPLRQLLRSQVVPVPVDDAFAFFADPLNLEAITPPWLGFRVLSHPDTLESGALIDYRLSLHRVPVSWRTRIEAWQPGRRFVDLQLRGPFGSWEHVHEFAPVDCGTLIVDRVRYRMPLGPLGAVVHVVLIGGDLDRIFDFRREAVGGLLGQPAR